MPSVAARTLLPVLLLLLVIAACGPLPRPFQPPPEERTNNVLLQHPEGRGVHVLGIDNRKGAPAEAAAAELRAAGLPAATALSNAGSYVLTGYSRTEARPGPNEAVEVQWVLSDPRGHIIRNDTETVSLPDGLWANGTPETLRPYLAPAMGRLAAAIAPEDRAPSRIVEGGLPGFPGARVAISKITAPGDGSRSLASAMEKALRAADLPVATTAMADDVLILGDVTLSPEINGMQRVVVSWTLRDPRGSQPLGTVRQENRVPEGTLSGPWGPNARAVADAAIPGIVDLLDKAAALRRQ